MRYFRFFIRNQINRTEFKVTFMMLFLIGTGGLIMCYVQNYQENLVLLRSAADSFLLVSTESRVICMMYTLIFPLLASSLCSGYRNGGVLFSLQRMDKRKYVYGNAAAVVCLTVISFMAALGLNQLLCFSAFPLSAASNRWGMTEYGLMNSYVEGNLFDFWTAQNPYVYNVLFIITGSVLAGGVALLTYGLGYVRALSGLKPVLLSVIVFLMFIALFVIDGIFDFNAINYQLYVAPSEASLISYLIFTGGIYLAGVLLTVKGKREYECL